MPFLFHFSQLRTTLQTQLFYEFGLLVLLLFKYSTPVQLIGSFCASVRPKELTSQKGGKITLLRIKKKSETKTTLTTIQVTSYECCDFERITAAAAAQATILYLMRVRVLTRAATHNRNDVKMLYICILFLG